MSGEQPLPVSVYASRRRQEMYLYVARDMDLETLPASLMQHFGEPRHVMDLSLHSRRTLARADVETVITTVREQGFYLQMPPSPVPGGEKDA